MAKKKNLNLTPERLQEYARTMRHLEERIAYHRGKLAEEDARRDSSG